jgi:DNA-directed RNA polymerase subunit RPC12/RpoP
MFTSDEQLTIEDLPMIEVKEECEKCGEQTKKFEEILEDGINCPHCKEKLTQNRWFSTGGSETREDKEAFEKSGQKSEEVKSEEAEETE